MAKDILLYDHERDKNLEVGQALLVFEDGTTRRVRESSLYGKEVTDVKQPTEVQRPGAIRSKPTRTLKPRAKNARQTPARKRFALYTA